MALHNYHSTVQTFPPGQFLWLPGDGSVKFFSQDISQLALIALTTRRGGDSVSGADF